MEVLPEIKEHLEEHLYSAHGADGIEKAELGAYSGDKLEEDVDVHHSSAVVQPKRHHRHHHSHRHHHKKKPGKEKVTELEGDKKQSKHHHRHVHRHAHRRPRTIAEREQYLESIESRLRSGSFTLRETMQEKQVTELEEAEALDKRDLEEMTCEFKNGFQIALMYPFFDTLFMKEKLKSLASCLIMNYSTVDALSSYMYSDVCICLE